MDDDLRNRNGTPRGVCRRARDCPEQSEPAAGIGSEQTDGADREKDRGEGSGNKASARSSVPKLEGQAELCNWRRPGKGPADAKGRCQCGCAGGGPEGCTGGQKADHDPRRSDGDAEKVRERAKTRLRARQSDAVREKQKGGGSILC